MCHHLRGWRSKVLDNCIREIQKEQMGVLTCGNGVIPLDFGPNNSMGGKNEREKKEKGERRRR